MIEITNRLKGPVQILVRSKRKSSSFVPCNIPGKGAGKNKIMIEDERITEYVQRAERSGLISTKYLNDTVETKE